MDKLRVVELFAGVGGFRLGLEGYKGHRKAHHKNFETVWFNQWEPATKKQHAHEVYVNKFGDADEYTNVDIAEVTDKVPDHDLLVGGFPCQDYSVARNLSSSTGLEGKKGVLWWSIYEILQLKGKDAPKYLILENVDRLLGSPAKQRGRDFAVILSCLNSLGYVVEWRIVNAGDYGFPQRRRRIFILGYKKGSNVEKYYRSIGDPVIWLKKKGLTQYSFPATSAVESSEFDISLDPVKISENFNLENPAKSPFKNSGVAVDGTVYTLRQEAKYSRERTTLKDVLLSNKEVPEEYFIKDKKDLERWTYFKGAKKEPRKAKSGYEFIYSEGPVAFPDPLDKPSRTIITGEGGPTPSRFKHVIKTRKGLRRLTPVELERLCMFPDGHTEGNTDSRRAFFMGNALVVGVVDKLGKGLVHMDKKGEEVKYVRDKRSPKPSSRSASKVMSANKAKNTELE